MEPKDIRNVEKVQGDVTSYKCPAIIHQCNCVSKNAAGVAKAIFQTFPEANVYKDRSDTRRDAPGTIKAVNTRGTKTASVAAPLIINLFGQVYPGPAKFKGDTSDDRLGYFEKGLKLAGETLNRLGITEVAVPNGIGCGMAGGDMHDYMSLIRSFSTNHKLKVWVVNLH